MAQNASLDQTLNSLQKQATDFPFEKVYLQMDKPYYSAGDTIWFKGYIVTGAAHRLSGLSNVLNVELADQQNIIRKSIKLPLISGITRGDFALADTIPEGNYRIRAYTNLMRNAGDDYFFDKTIAIANAVTNKVFTKTIYSYSSQNGQQTVIATITYADLAGNPYANKEVRYEVNLESQKPLRGKGVTGDNGKLEITFVNANPAVSTTGNLVTNINIDNQKIVRKVVAIKATGTKTDVQFFPESGNLVNGVRSKIAFKAVGADGRGAAIKGTVSDNQGNELAVINNSHLGMGSFILVPEAGKTYKANIIDPDGTQNTLDLPKALDKGYVLSVNNTDSLNLVVRITGAGVANQSGGLNLVAQSGGVVYLQAKGTPGKSSFSAVIPKNKLPSGIVQFTLFSDAGEPLNERLVFLQNPDQLKLAISTAKAVSAPREKVKVNLDVMDSQGKPVQGNFSVSVIDETKVPADENSENGILSNLLLTSDIKGYIEQPGYYFANVTAKTTADLDLLMLTQGYHRFEWKQIRNNVSPAMVFQPEKAITISGIVKSQNGKPVDNGKVTLARNTGAFLAMDTLTDKNGRFAFSLDFRDSSRFTIKAATAKGDKDVLIAMDAPPVQASVNKNAADIKTDPDNEMQPYLQNSKKHYDEELKNGIGEHSIILNEININMEKPKTEKQLKIERAVEFSSNLNGRGNADQIITSEAFEGMGCPHIADCLAGKLLGITFDKNGNPHSTRANNSISLSTGMLIIIDNLPGGINDIDVDNISSVEVLRSGYYTAIYGTRASGGVMIITSKHGSGFTDDIKGGASYLRPQGYYKSREFYSPQYDNPKTNTAIADLRTTVYWKSILQTDKDGKASFEYFNAGAKGTCRVVVEGIDYNGSLGRQVYRYKVE